MQDIGLKTLNPPCPISSTRMQALKPSDTPPAGRCKRGGKCHRIVERGEMRRADGTTASRGKDRLRWCCKGRVDLLTCAGDTSQLSSFSRRTDITLDRQIRVWKAWQNAIFLLVRNKPRKLSQKTLVARPRKGGKRAGKGWREEAEASGMSGRGSG